MLGRTEMRTRDKMYCQAIRTVRYISETIEQELRPAVCEHRQTDIRRIVLGPIDYKIPCSDFFVLAILQLHGSR